MALKDKLVKSDYKTILHEIRLIIMRLSILIIFIIGQFIYLALNKGLHNVHRVETFIDRIIPFNKIFIIPYLLWYIYIFGTVFFFAVTDARVYYRLVASIVAGMFVCYIIFGVFQTTVPRPEVNGRDALTLLVRYVYAHDNPYNCLPSLHVFDAITVSIFLFRKRCGFLWRATIIFIAVLISISTMLVKQHYLYDVLTGALLAFISCSIFGRRVFWEKHVPPGITS